jgi:hypothetical protein
MAMLSFAVKNYRALFVGQEPIAEGGYTPADFWIDFFTMYFCQFPQGGLMVDVPALKKVSAQVHTVGGKLNIN